MLSGASAPGAVSHGKQASGEGSDLIHYTLSSYAEPDSGDLGVGSDSGSSFRPGDLSILPRNLAGSGGGLDSEGSGTDSGSEGSDVGLDLEGCRTGSSSCAGLDFEIIGFESDFVRPGDLAIRPVVHWVPRKIQAWTLELELA